MAQRTDLYSILVSYANKNNSPYIDIEPFLDFLGRYAKKVSGEQPEWLKWTQDRQVKFWAEMSGLVEEGKCELLTDTDHGRVYMPHFYLELLEGAYRKPDEDADLPFPNEESLRITLPETQMRPLNSGGDIIAYLEEPRETELPILKINFPDEFGSALVLPGAIPRRLTEMSILKVRNYLRRHGNREYAFRKLTPQLQGRESSLRDQLNRVMTRPLDCYSVMEGGGDFSYLFWAHFSILVKNDIRKKKERLADDIASFQAIHIIEAVNGYFKALTVRKREAELAFRSLESHLAKPPYLYTLEQIVRFTNSKGVLLLGQYTEEELEEWIKAKITESEDNKMPPILIVHGAKDERCYILKEKIPALSARLFSDARGQIREAVSKHWEKLLLDYDREPAMENDGEFEKILVKFTTNLCPLLQNLLIDPKMLLVYEELEQDGVPVPVKLYSGELLPYSVLFTLRRKELLADIRLMLPFWYSMPILSAIIVFFRNLMKKRKEPKLPAGIEVMREDYSGEEKNHSREIRAAAEDLEFSMIPPGHTMDSYLEELESRWSRLIDKRARENLIEDVQSLIRDNLRRNLKIQKKFRLTAEVLNQMAVNIITRTPSLSSLSGRNSLILYAELYLIKLLENIK